MTGPRDRPLDRRTPIRRGSTALGLTAAALVPVAAGGAGSAQEASPRLEVMPTGAPTAKHRALADGGRAGDAVPVPAVPPIPSPPPGMGGRVRRRR